MKETVAQFLSRGGKIAKCPVAYLINSEFVINLAKHEANERAKNGRETKRLVNKDRARKQKRKTKERKTGGKRR